MTKPILAMILAILASLACGQLITPPPTAVPVLPIAATVVITATVPPSPSMTPSPVPATLTARVTADTVNVRSSPNGKVIAMLWRGAVVTVLECASSWCKIKWNKYSGYIWQGCISFNPNSLGCSEAR